MIKFLKSSIFVLGFLIYLSALASAIVNVKICRKKDGLFPKPGSMCKAYYKCTKYVPVELLCPPEHHFNTIKLRCDWMSLFPCLEKPKREECPTSDGKFLKAGTGCVYYYDCCNGEPTEKKCSTGHLFDPSKGRCELKSHYTCIEGISTEEPTSTVLATTSRITEPTPEEIVPSTTLIRESTTEENASPSIEINESTPEEEVVHFTTSIPDSTSEEIMPSPTSILGSTPPEEIVDLSTSIEEATLEETGKSTTLICETTFEESTTATTETDERTTILEEVSVSTENEQITDEPNIMCPEPFGYFPHPTDKHKFVGCVDNIPSVLTCPSDLIYDHEHRQCVYQ